MENMIKTHALFQLLSDVRFLTNIFIYVKHGRVLRPGIAHETGTPPSCRNSKLVRKPLLLQCTGWFRKLESRREMLDGASVARLQWDKHLPETAIYRSSDLQSMMFVPFSKDFCGDQYLYLLFIPTLVKILQSHCSLPPTTSSKSGFFLTPAMLTNTTSYLSLLLWRYTVRVRTTQINAKIKKILHLTFRVGHMRPTLNAKYN